MLCDANLVGREYERHGKHVARYSIKEDGIRFLKNIGAVDKLRRLSKQKSVSTKHRRYVKPDRSWLLNTNDNTLKNQWMRAKFC